jgi:glycosyltransferase involved in cell wall biosynthesis
MVLPQLYREVMPRGDKYDGSFHIVVFGGVDTNKRPGLIIDATLNALQAGCSIHLHVAGNVQKDCLPLLERIQQSPLKDVTHIHGRVEHDELLQLISEMDVCIALRYPTMGETSAIVMRALQAGTPVIVNDVGWYSELPGFLAKLRPTDPDELKELTALLTVFSSKGPEYQALRGETQRYADTVCQFDRVTKDYAGFILSTKEVVQ